MKNEGKQVLKIGAIFSGTVIGAGFASGQELNLFFVRFGAYGGFGIILAGVLFSVFAMMILSAGKKLAPCTFQSYTERLFGRRLGKIYDGIIVIFMMAIFCVMVAGGDALFYEQFNAQGGFGAFLTALICYFILQGDERHLAAINMLLVPFMIVGMVLVSVWYLFCQTQAVWAPFEQVENHFFFSAMLYVSYNMMTAAAVLIPVSRGVKRTKTAIVGGALGGALLLLIAVLIFFVLMFAGSDIGSKQLPLLAVSEQLGRWVSFLYSIVLYMAMLTTAAANGFSVMEHISKKGKSRGVFAAFLCVLSVFSSRIPFSKMLDSCYHFFGVLGLLFLCAVFIDWWRNVK